MQINSDKQLAQLGGKKNRLPTVEGKIVRWDQWGQSERRDTLQPAEQNSAGLFFSFLSFSFFFSSPSYFSECAADKAELLTLMYFAESWNDGFL